MKIDKPKFNIKCEIGLCNKTATIEFKTGSYKGNIYLCDNCFKEFQNLFKRKVTNETKK